MTQSSAIDMLVSTISNLIYDDELLNIPMATFLAIIIVVCINKLFGDLNPVGRSVELMNKFFVQEGKRNINVNEFINEYNELHKDDENDLATGENKRNASYAILVNAYYELATLFYEWGWGQSFHFAYQLKGESFKSAIARHEYFLAGKLGVSAGDNVLDVGCGIGGPMRNIAKFTRANITGVTLNEYQVIRGNELNKSSGLLKSNYARKNFSNINGSALSVQGNFMDLKNFGDNSFDGVYAIEATCHAPNREGVYSEIYRVLKPGKVFACYEWVLTDKFNHDDEHHQLIKKKIEEGDGLPDIISDREVVAALHSVGFEVLEARDMALDDCYGGDPWYWPLHPSWNPFNFRFQMNPVGTRLIQLTLTVLEFLRLAPKGSAKVQDMLQQGAWGLDQGGW
jgi:sterol 24-C-methyltransferase